METKYIKSFIYSAGGILLAAALMRFLVAAGTAQALALPEPMLGIPLRYAVLMVGIFELVVALICLFGKHVGLQIGWLAWLSTNLVVFWIGLLTMHYHPQATCIGSLTDLLHLARGTTGHIMEFTPVYLLMGSYAALIWVWLESRTAQAHKLAAESLKISCPACGGHIRFAIQNLGQKISCPHCQKETTLRKPESLKMSCFFCKEHIEFPAHALGQKIFCPHCNRGITLMEQA